MGHPSFTSSDSGYKLLKKIIENFGYMNQQYLSTITTFLTQIGIQVIEKKLEGDCFLPGLEIGPDIIYFDPDKFLYVGDLLHEAGHIAVTEEKFRPHIGQPNMAKIVGEKSWPTEGDEIASISWSAAAAIYLTIPLEVVFHPEGYREGSEWIINEINSGSYLGLPLLEWMGLCDAKEYPNMKRWLRA